MTNEHRDRASAVTNANRRKDSDSSSPWPKRGVAGKVGRAKATAPEGIDGLKVLAVAHAAYERNVSVEEIWQEVDA